MRWKLWVGGLFVSCGCIKSGGGLWVHKKRPRASHFVLVVIINKPVVKVER